MKAKYPKSFYDCDGVLLVYCSECTRGYNGTEENKCSCGCKKTVANSKSYCAIGMLTENVDKTRIRSLPRIIRHASGDKKTCFDGTPCRGIEKCAGWDVCQKKQGV